MKTAAPFLALVLALAAPPPARAGDAPDDPARWPAERAAAWGAKQPWIVGFNYIPATAINYTEMWQRETFDPKTIDAELALAQETGFNALRCVLQYLVWEHDPDGLKERMDAFLGICKQRGLRAMFCLFDDCVFGPKQDPYLGKQADVVPGWYAHDWSPSPGWSRVRNRDAWPKLETYVKDVLTRFRDDPRVLSWDLYNEPTNGIGDVSLPLVERVFDRAREVNASQPLTVGVWNGNAKLNALALSRSDLITFHNYGDVGALTGQVADLLRRGRPVVCTEWLNRGQRSLVETHLPVFWKNRVGCLHWGLVNGKTQTQFPWGSKAGAPEPAVWQHDLYRKDRTPYDPKELDLFRRLIREAPPEAKVVVPTSAAAPATWRWTTEPPPDGWFRPDFDASGWKEGPGVFGTAGTPGANVRTTWNTPAIWLRREFTLDAVPARPALAILHDEDARVYVNGVPAAETTNWVTDYVEVEMAPAARAALKPGRNVLAVHCRQTTGGQSIDVGILDLIPGRRP